ncbi:MAG: TraR/DksA C4-type zinc finger protein [Bacillota bacterium]
MSGKNGDRNRDYKALLEKEKKILLSHMAKEGFSLRESTAELTVIDNHPADTGSELFERSKDLAIYDRHVKKLRDIEDALERLSQGKFGYCRACGGPIPGERLDAVPYAAYCLSCQSLREKETRENEQDDRPVEELLLSTPFARTFACQRDGDECEGEDAWEDVSQYGSADSLQDRPEDNTPDRRRRVDS